MNMTIILISMAVLGGIGLLFGLILSFAGIKLKVGEDPKLTALKGLMPGANCGGCGFAGCNGFAEAVFEGNASYDGCLVGRRAGLGAKVEALMTQ